MRRVYRFQAMVDADTGVHGVDRYVQRYAAMPCEYKQTGGGVSGFERAGTVTGTLRVPFEFPIEASDRIRSVSTLAGEVVAADMYITEFVVGEGEVRLRVAGAQEGVEIVDERIHLVAGTTPIEAGMAPVFIA